MEMPAPDSPSGNLARFVGDEYRRRFGALIGVFRAPGRVNLIGEHTDYNDGFVMPAALGFATFVAAGARSDGHLSVYSADFAEAVDFSLDAASSGPTGHWSDYPRGVAAEVRAHGVPWTGANLVIKGAVPIGAGLSSSAAIEVATAMALLAVSHAALDLREIASICQRAEHNYAGTKCGIMDQFISCFGQANHALLLDCRSLDYQLLPLSNRARIVICNSMVRHDLAAGEYNLRRADCEAGVRFLQHHLPGVRALRDVSPSQLEQFANKMPDQVLRRCRHVVNEIARTLAAAETLRRDDLKHFGVLMRASHISLRDDYEVSCRELDLLVELAGGCRGVFGARMTGGGFGGCTVNLVNIDDVASFEKEVGRSYQAATGRKPDIYVCTAADGASAITEGPE
jgi:galactokinase